MCATSVSKTNNGNYWAATDSKWTTPNGAVPLEHELTAEGEVAQITRKGLNYRYLLFLIKKSNEVNKFPATFSFGSTNTATTSTAGFGGFGTATSSGFGAFGSTATSTGCIQFKMKQ